MRGSDHLCQWKPRHGFLLVDQSIRIHQNKVIDQRMHNNYDRLFQELTELVEDREVYQSLDDHLKFRVDCLFTTNKKASPNLIFKQLTYNDTQTLFTKNNTSYCDLESESVVLKDTTNSNILKKKHTLNSSGRITAKKIETSAFDEIKKGSKYNKTKNQSLTKNKSNHKSNRDLIKYNLHTSKSKSKEKDVVRKVLVECPSKKKIHQQNLHRNTDYLALFEGASRQNRKHLEDKSVKKEKKQSICTKTCKTEQNSTLFQSKLKTVSSTLCQSREILKKLATIQTQPSRISLSSNKTQTTKQTRSLKIPEKQLTVMQAINKKQDVLNMQRRQYENQIKVLQQMIDKQRNRIDIINANIAKANTQISKTEVHERGCSQQIKISRKKSQHFISESRRFENHIIEVSKSKGTVCASIEQEKYLINMYMTVIEEIKSQLKIEQSQKIDLIKRLVVIKNTQKMSMEKYLSKEAASDQIFRGMSESMKKWV